MSSTAFQSVTPYIPRLVGLGYGAFPLDADQFIDGGGGGEDFTVTLFGSSCSWSVTATSEPNGLNLVTPDDFNEVSTSAAFPAGTNLTITVGNYVPPIFDFDIPKWTGDIDPNPQELQNNSINIVVNSDKTIRFEFACSD